MTPETPNVEVRPVDRDDLPDFVEGWSEKRISALVLHQGTGEPFAFVFENAEWSPQEIAEMLSTYRELKEAVAAANAVPEPGVPTIELEDGSIVPRKRFVIVHKEWGNIATYDTEAECRAFMDGAMEDHDIQDFEEDARDVLGTLDLIDAKIEDAAHSGDRDYRMRTGVEMYDTAAELYAKVEDLVIRQPALKLRFENTTKRILMDLFGMLESMIERPILDHLAPTKGPAT